MRRSRWIAATALTGAALAVALVLSSGGTGPRLVATFGDVRGLVAGAQVRIAGIPVGSVTSVDLGPGALPRVRMQLDAGVRLHRGATAAVRLASLSGEFNRYVALQDGGGAALASGAVLAARSTRSPVEFDEAQQALGPATRADVRATLHGLVAATRGRGPALAATLRSSGLALATTAEVLRQVDADGTALRALVRAGAQVGATLASSPQTIGTSADRIAALLHTTAARSRALGATAAGLPAGLAAAGAVLGRAREAIGPLRSLVAAARPGVRQLVGAAADLDPLLRDARPVLARARALSGHAPADLRALRGLVAHAQPLLERMGPVLERLGPMLDQSRVRLPDFFSFFSNWADFTSNYDANGHGARVGIVLTPTPTNELSPDSNGAGELAPPYLRLPGALEGAPWRDYAKSFVAGGHG
jgi:virulence factor Mce-like protein